MVKDITPQVVIGALVNKYVWHYTSVRNKNGTWTLTGLDFRRKLALGDLLDSYAPSAVFRIIEEPTWTDSTATFEGEYAKVDPKGIKWTAVCEFLKPVDRNPKKEQAAK